MTMLSFIGAIMAAAGGLLLGGACVLAAARRWFPRYEDPAMYLYFTTVGIAVYLIGRFA